MAELDVLDEALNQELITKPLQQNEVYEVVLLERDPKAKLKKVTIEGMNSEATVLKLDKASKFESIIFQKGLGQLRRCDYVILIECDGNRYAVLIEMKSSFCKKEEYLPQFKGAECLLDYIDSVLSRFYGQNKLLSLYEKRFALLYKSHINKTTTRFQKPKKNNKPENALEYPVDNSNLLNIKELVCE